MQGLLFMYKICINEHYCPCRGTDGSPKRLFREGTLNPLKISQATEALQEMVVNASAEALSLRAAAMFSKSVDVKTGDIPWTRGELLGKQGFYRSSFAQSTCGTC